MQKPSKTLFVDTATKYVYLALVEDGVETGSVYQEGVNNHSVTVMPLLDELLKKHQLKLRDLTEIIVGVGPGSYTGVRIGVSIAKMIGYLNQTPVKTVSSLALIASGAPDGTVLSLIDARRENAFMALYEKKHGVMRELIPDALENIVLFKSNILGTYETRTTGKPDALVIIRSGLTFPVADIHGLIPNYLQVTEAERKKADA